MRRSSTPQPAPLAARTRVECRLPRRQMGAGLHDVRRIAVPRGPRDCARPAPARRLDAAGDGGSTRWLARTPSHSRRRRRAACGSRSCMVVQTTEPVLRRTVPGSCLFVKTSRPLDQFTLQSTHISQPPVCFGGGGAPAMTSLLEAEIRSQPEVIAGLLAHQLPAIEGAARALPLTAFDYALIAARGSSDHAALYAKYAWGALAGVPVAL